MSFFSDWLNRYAQKKAYKWGRGRARVKLFAFYAYKRANPELSNEELYYLTILKSPRFTEKESKFIVDRAANEAEGYTLVPDLKVEEGEAQIDYLKVSVPSVFEEPFCLRSVVKHMLTYETVQYERRKGVPHPLELSEAWKAVDDVIPADL